MIPNTGKLSRNLYKKCNNSESFIHTFRNVKIDPQVFPAATDSRFIRVKGIPAFGFSPINNTPILLHDHNEFLNEKIFLRGIEIFEGIIKDLGNM